MRTCSMAPRFSARSISPISSASRTGRSAGALVAVMAASLVAASLVLVSGRGSGGLGAGRLGLLDERLEARRVLHRDIGQHLAVHLDAGDRQAVDEVAVGHAVLAGGGVDA